MNHSLRIALTWLLLAGGGTARAQETNTAPPADHDPFQALVRNNIFNQSRTFRDYGSGSRPRLPRVETVTLCGIGVDDGGGEAIFQGSNRAFKAGETYMGLKIVRLTVDSATLSDSSGDAPANSSGETLINSTSNILLTNSTSNLLATHATSNSSVTNSTNNSLVTHSISNGLGTNSTSDSSVTNSTNNSLTANSSGKAFVLNVGESLRREAGGPWRFSGYIAPEPASDTNSTAAIASATASGAGDNDIIAKLKKKREQEEK